MLNLGRYERQAYLNVGGRLTRQEEGAGARAEGAGIPRADPEGLPRRAAAGDRASSTARRGARLVVVGPINLPVGRLFVEEVITECRKRGASRVDVLAFEFEMGLFPAVLDEAKQKGIDLAPKTHPAGGLRQARRGARARCVFHDVAYIEVTPRFDSKNKLTLRDRADRLLRLLLAGRWRTRSPRS